MIIIGCRVCPWWAGASRSWGGVFVPEPVPVPDFILFLSLWINMDNMEK